MSLPHRHGDVRRLWNQVRERPHHFDLSLHSLQLQMYFILKNLFQEGAEESNSTSSASLHRPTVHEGHSRRTTDDLHPSNHVHPLPGPSVRNNLSERNAFSRKIRPRRALMLLFWPFTYRLLPWEANVVTYRFMGGDKCMLPFIKHVETKTANGHITTSWPAFSDGPWPEHCLFRCCCEN